MKIRVFDTPEQAGLYAASLIERIVLEIPQPVLGLATGSTVIPLYQELIRLHRCGLDFSHVVTINLDEYIGLPASHPQSYHHFMQTHLFSHIQVPLSQIHIPNGNAEDLEAECEAYDDLLRRHPIDLQILGIGVNGHIGFNEPDDLLVSRTHVVQLSEQTIRSNARFFQNEAEVPRQAITMGVQAILQARQIVLLAFGPEKAQIVAQAIHGEVRTDVPASILQLHRDVTFVLDQESAREVRLGNT
ncbi:MAG: glucosamine-6-phosphate deaminase [Alicyclobacillus herbarius]|uniref:glucosamine-6-phosphate deaminase n=1 Tax=Alicyclobacillus herbarius TaxID=122960 RepID=UPI0023543FC2|nr:glucosamine-6-phosphate deaminase [Alicyclobacillus herbarius]MCL6632513.1 glucosamine-6-phosphate deaminase [Alicyclobacillus herbarius]